MNKYPTTLIKQRRIVIAVQLGVLLFILVGLFGSYLLKPAEQNQNSVDLESVAVTKPVPNDWSSLQDVTVRAKAAYVWDVKEQRALYEKQSTASLPLASITKLMTTLLAYELISENETGSINEQALRQDGSTGFSDGEQFSLKNLSRLALIPSSNDAAFALAASVGEYLGPEAPAAQFVAGMNIRAEELGLETVSFKNPTGLDISASEPGAVGSAEDVSHLLEYILRNYPEMLEPTQLEAARVYNTTGEYHDVENTNQLVRQIPNLLASKTGYTDLAGGNLTIAFDAGFNRPIIVTVLGSTYEERFSDVMRLVTAVQEDLNRN